MFGVFEIKYETFSVSHLPQIIPVKIHQTHIIYQTKHLLKTKLWFKWIYFICRIYVYYIFVVVFAFLLFPSKNVRVAQRWTQPLRTSLCWIALNGICFLFYSFWLTIRLLLKQFEKTLRKKKRMCRRSPRSSCRPHHTNFCTSRDIFQWILLF